ncbi:ribosome biogenesis GTP-binding protein YihA/YsxC [Mesomycoplasma flocculare]|uniref:ribosome biogenesis GTP-binding protein YihA/YsxC n=1 Tax=Mesomycoplasma flocculare TaxID=2128 RepID=UPI0013709075|nr:ribosome biogenesis GTP-binding protein YihA/YsxC [Mesomycoplasma flocculare]MXR22781.1 YihA family ribosome biogenesis GTP-binding protein [Mesomycoplasma flocculare]
MWKFLKSCTENCYSEPQFAFIGRSNVGKSSLINALANKKIARISAQPGRTQLLNFYHNQSNKLVVDLPGYGFARISKTKKTGIELMIANYFAKNQTLLCVFLLIDARIGFSDLDFEMIEFIISFGHKIQILANKVDKTNQSQRAKLAKQCEKLALNCLLVSAKTKLNFPKLVNLIS